MLDTIIYQEVTLLDIIWALVLFICIVLITRSITIYLRRSLKDDLKHSELKVLLKGVNFVALIIALIIIIPILGIDPMGILVAGGIIGLVLAFACQSIISNFISGIFLALERPIKIGDGVNINDREGTVEDVKIMSTIIRGYDGYIYRLANEKVFTNRITNYSSTLVRRFEYLIGIRYKDDSSKAIEIINNMIEIHPLLLKNPTHQVFVDNLGENGVNIIVRVWAPSSEWYGIKMEFLLKIKSNLESNGIKIAMPQRAVWLNNQLQENTTS